MGMAKVVRDRREIERQVRELGPWFHNMELAGIQTAPEHFLGDYPNVKWTKFRDALPQDLTGRTVLDIGCNAGFFSIEMKRRGADRVVGIDSDDRYLRQADYAARLCNADIELRHLSVYDVEKLGERFDLILFMGVLYHLRHPLLALDLIREWVAEDMLVCQSMLRGSADIEPIAADYPFSEDQVFDRPGAPKLHFIEHRYAEDQTNWWIPNRACLEAMLRSSGFRIEAQPEPEVYVCRVGERPYDVELP